MNHPDDLRAAPTPAQTGNPKLCALIRQRIQAAPHQRVTFADFMDWALYDPTHGYYAINAVQIGVKGDFFTAPHLGADFGELLAEQFLDMWQALACPESFTLVEMGAGQGLIAMDVLRYLAHQAQASVDPYPQFWQALRYIIVEKAAALIAEQQHHLKGFNQQTDKVRWLALDALEPDSITGCFFSNELVDALPVHQVTFTAAGLQEIYVTVGTDQAFVETVGTPSTPELAIYLDHQEIELANYPEGYRTEINLQALDWLSRVASKLKHGYLLTIDYGYPASQYYSPGRAQGTLQCYRNHAHHNNPYLYVGEQDITAHVNFTALEQQGQWVGLDCLGRTQQGPFLMALGLGDRLVANNTREDVGNLAHILRRREALHGLLNPLGLGGFQVLVQGKGLGPKRQGSPIGLSPSGRLP